MLRPLGGLIWKDVKLFGVDRQAMVMSLAVPVIIASILGWLDSSGSDAKSPNKVSIQLVDEDRTPASADFLSRLIKGGSVAPKVVDRPAAMDAIQHGSVSLVAIVPKGFAGQAAAAASGAPKPEIAIYRDPAEAIDAEIATGAVEQAASGAAARAAYGALGDAGSPVAFSQTTVAASGVSWGKAAHDYAGFGLQGLLFFAIESAVSLSRERRLGIWKRLRSAPIKPNLLLLSKGVSSAALAFGVILLIFLVGALLFHIRARGTVAGFALVAVGSALMASTFGLLIATIGRTETQSRAISILLILVMLATGGAWFPIERMPPAVQTAAEYLPVRWAVEGFDAATWRGLDFASVSRYGMALFGFALIFGTVAALRFRFGRVAD